MQRATFYTPFPHGDGQMLLREALLLIADHTAKAIIPGEHHPVAPRLPGRLESKKPGSGTACGTVVGNDCVNKPLSSLIYTEIVG